MPLSLPRLGLPSHSLTVVCVFGWTRRRCPPPPTETRGYALLPSPSLLHSISYACALLPLVPSLCAIGACGGGGKSGGDAHQGPRAGPAAGHRPGLPPGRFTHRGGKDRGSYGPDSTLDSRCRLEGVKMCASRSCALLVSCVCVCAVRGEGGADAGVAGRGERAGDTGPRRHTGLHPPGNHPHTCPPSIHSTFSDQVNPWILSIQSIAQAIASLSPLLISPPRPSRRVSSMQITQLCLCLCGRKAEVPLEEVRRRDKENYRTQASHALQRLLHAHQEAEGRHTHTRLPPFYSVSMVLVCAEELSREAQ